MNRNRRTAAAPVSTSIRSTASPICLSIAADMSTLPRVPTIRQGAPTHITSRVMNSFSTAWPDRAQTRPIAAQTKTGAMIARISISIGGLPSPETRELPPPGHCKRK